MRIRRLLMLIIAIIAIAVPATAIARSRIEVGGAHSTLDLTGSDQYGSMRVDLSFGNHGKEWVSHIAYTNACGTTTTIPGVFDLRGFGVFAGTRPGHAVSGVVTVSGSQSGTLYTVRGTVESVHTCRGVTAPVTFTASGG